MRNAFISELCLLARSNKKIFLIVGDLGYSVIEPFVSEFPDRFINAGVAEQNMMGTAAGLASEGFHVFVYSIANFPTFRCAEQIRNDVAYHQLPVTIVSVGGGLAYGALGYSHHAVQDYALMRCMPHMLIAAPGDPMEVRACLRYLSTHPQPSYLRLGKAGEVCHHITPPVAHPGQWIRVRAGDAADRPCLLSTGTALNYAMKLSDSRGPYLGASVYTLPLWGMQQKPSQPAQCAAQPSVTTLEDHLYDGGFGSWLMEALAHHPTTRGQLHQIALDPVVCGMVGTEADLLRASGWQP